MIDDYSMKTFQRTISSSKMKNEPLCLILSYQYSSINPKNILQNSMCCKNEVAMLKNYISTKAFPSKISCCFKYYSLTMEECADANDAA